MLYRKDVCPHCGNEITAKSVETPQKCRWCKRLFIAEFKKNKGKKWHHEVKPIYK